MDPEERFVRKVLWVAAWAILGAALLFVTGYLLGMGFKLAVPPQSIKESLWTLEQGIELVRQIEAVIRPLGLFSGITGSVLYKGLGKKDLDLIVSPLDATVPFPRKEFDQAMRGLGLKLWMREPWLKKIWAEQEIKDTKHVEVWETKDEKRVDVFILK